AEPEDVYGTKEAGIRLVTMTDTVTGDTVHRDAFGRLIGTAQSDDGTLTIPGSVLERALCVTGTLDVTVDTHGNPLDLGREARLYSARQKLVMAVRDGGCLWPGCDRPPAYCEAHHCEHWSDGGNTDCASGVLLCRYHHLHLHNTGWRIEPCEGGGFVLHAPPGMNLHPIPLRSKSSLRWLWDPPPDRPPWRTAA
ncbi:HNH endonuclease signature motif containing protein, partial [Microbacterium sp.]|uniref:HNH endonuclease signature motif containing protein n=1 Tax=Microbacterium sp. TaxID=51671 RepID=UPI0039E2D189